MFEKTLMILEEDRREQEKAAAEVDEEGMGGQTQAENPEADRRKVSHPGQAKGAGDLGTLTAFTKMAGTWPRLRDGFTALGVRLNDREFNMMLKIWDKDNEGEMSLTFSRTCLKSALGPRGRRHEARAVAGGGGRKGGAREGQKGKKTEAERGEESEAGQVRAPEKNRGQVGHCCGCTSDSGGSSDSDSRATGWQ